MKIVCIEIINSDGGNTAFSYSLKQNVLLCSSFYASERRYELCRCEMG